mmetsp:Transcript_67899/g.112869  ORF Transcript_67899/g.112869 Transcript_67899/m.112869 type:complete len:241 (-) Transcript_67899:1478-2200(-)
MAKSAELAACIPSWPEIPTPTCAACIIATSFAPSPIARVVALCTLSLTRETSCAFCDGAHRHATTAEQYWVYCRKASWQPTLSPLLSTLSTISSASPSMTRARFGRALPVISALRKSSAYCRAPALSRSWILSLLVCDFALTISMCVVWSNSWHAYAILIAVSSLSPVRTHSEMPARPRSAMHAGTPTCSLSSMAVEPSSFRSTSIRSHSLSISFGSSRAFFSSSSVDWMARRYSCDHFL